MSVQLGVALHHPFDTQEGGTTTAAAGGGGGGGGGGRGALSTASLSSIILVAEIRESFNDPCDHLGFGFLPSVYTSSMAVRICSIWRTLGRMSVVRVSVHTISENTPGHLSRAAVIPLRNSVTCCNLNLCVVFKGSSVHAEAFKASNSGSAKPFKKSIDRSVTAALASDKTWRLTDLAVGLG